VLTSDEAGVASLRGEAAWVVFHFDNETRLFRSSEHSGLERAEIARQLSFRMGDEQGVVGLVAARAAALYVANVDADPRWTPLDSGIQSAYFTPITCEAQVLGVFVLLGRANGSLDAAHRALADLFARERAKLWLVARRATDGDPDAEASGAQHSLDMSGLSQRERDVVNALCRGLRLTDIARVLGISNHTARNHLKHVFRKLGVHSQVELLSTIGRPLGPR
jgi:DNA-binding CsgD family transcriptional regulator